LIAVIGICLFFCGILTAINTLYHLQTIPLPIYTQNNLKEQYLLNEERRKLTDPNDYMTEAESRQYYAQLKSTADAKRTIPKTAPTAAKDDLHQMSDAEVTQQSQPEEEIKRSGTVPMAQSEEEQLEIARQQRVREQEDIAKQQRKQEAAEPAAKEAAKRQREEEEEEVKRVETALLKYLKGELPNTTDIPVIPMSKMSMYVHLPDDTPELPKGPRGFSPSPLTFEEAKREVQIWLQNEGTEFIKSNFRERGRQGQIDLTKCLTKLQQDSMEIVRYQVEIKIDIDELKVKRIEAEEKEIQRVEAEQKEVEGVEAALLKYFQDPKKMCIMTDRKCIMLQPDRAKEKVMLWMSNGGEEFIKCEFRKTGHQIEPLLYYRIALSLHSKDEKNLTLYGGWLVTFSKAIPPEIQERVTSCTPHTA